MTLSPLPDPLDPVDDWVPVFRDKVVKGQWNKITDAEMTRALELIDALIVFEDSNFEFAGCICGTYENLHPDDDPPGTRCARLDLVRTLRTPLV